MEEEEFKEADLHYLEDFTSGNKAVIEEIITLFLAQTPEDMNTLKHFVLQEDWEGAKSMAHHMKPTLTYVGAESLREILLSFEKMILHHADPLKISQAFEVMEQRFTALYEDLQRYLARTR